jgi:uncharacterized membrane protein (UPF0136 family)|tara:strand:+ start:198 stop:542 length:345 start_codon:yes stop_codon:yes gene_type:complete
MKAHTANLINSLVLIGLGLWGYYENTDAPTALIPVFFGIALLIATKGIKENNKIMSHSAILFTIIIFIALVGMRLPKSLDQGGVGLYRVIVMSGTSLVAIIFFIKSFIDARKNK